MFVSKAVVGIPQYAEGENEPNGEVSGRVNILQDQAEGIWRLIDQMESRLAVVLRAAPPKAESTHSDPMPVMHTEMGNRLQVVETELAASRRRLSELLDRIDL